MNKLFRVARMLATRLDEVGISVASVLRSATEVSKDASVGLKLSAETKTGRFHPMSIASIFRQRVSEQRFEHMAHYKKIVRAGGSPQRLIGG